jgi:hypothetical protein
MSSLNDTIALGLVLVLLFGAAALYLYTRVQQCEQKLNLVESILLDIKMGAELREYPDLGLSAPLPPIKPQDEAALYSAALEEAAIDSLSTDDKEEVTEDVKEVPLTNSPKAKAAAAPLVVTKAPAPLSVNYEAMTLVELKELGRQRSIKGFSTMRRSQILEALKTNDGSPSEGVPTKLNEEILTSLLEQASTFESLEAEPASE